jgi:hypothetical protein
MANNPSVNQTGNRVVISTPHGNNLRHAQAAVADNPLEGLTMPEVLAYLDTNVTDVAGARQALKYLAHQFFVLRAEYDREHKRA